MPDPFRQQHRQLTAQELNAVRDLKTAARLWNVLDRLPQTREVALAKARLEESVMWATKGVTA